MKLYTILLLLTISISAQNNFKSAEEFANPKTLFKKIPNPNSQAKTNSNQRDVIYKSSQTVLEDQVDSVVFVTAENELSKFEFEYDSESRITSQVLYNKSNNEWTAVTRNTKEYDEFGNVTLDLNEEYKNSSWVYVDKETARFDNHNNLLFRKRSEWSGHGWKIQTLYEWTYNDYGNIISSRFEQGISNEKQKYEHFYDELQRDTLTIKYELIEDQYTSTMKWTNYYDDDYYSVINMYYKWANESWNVQYISKQVLNDKDNLLEENFERWSQGKVEGTFLHLSEYDKLGMKLSKKSYENINDKWELYFEAMYTYDENGNQTFWTYKHYENKIFIDGDRYTQTYENGNEKSLISEKWDGSSWKIISSSFHNYDADGRLLSYKSEHWDSYANYLVIIETKNKYDLKGNIIATENHFKEGDRFEETRKTLLSYDSKNRPITVSNYNLEDGTFIPNNDYYYPSPIPVFINTGYHVLYLYYNNGENIVRNDEAIKPNYNLFQNYPNPFNPETVISFALSKQSNIKINLYDSIGEKVTTLTNDEFSPGTHYITVNSSAYSSGTYFYRLQVDGLSITKKMVILK